VTIMPEAEFFLSSRPMVFYKMELTPISGQGRCWLDEAIWAEKVSAAASFYAASTPSLQRLHLDVQALWCRLQVAKHRWAQPAIESSLTPSVDVPSRLLPTRSNRIWAPGNSPH